MCIFLDIFKKEHRTLHELQITIDTVSDLMKDTHEEKAREMGMKRKKKMEKYKQFERYTPVCVIDVSFSFLELIQMRCSYI